MSRIRANTITNQNANGAPNFPDGITVSGVVTATVSNSTLGTLAVTGNATVGGTLGVGGTLTYEDVTNVDSVGVITARSSINVNAASSGIGVTINSGGINVAGVITATSFSGIDSDKISEGNTEVETIDTGSDGHVKFSTEGGERLRIGPAGQIGIAGANYGTSGQVLTSGGASAVPTWGTISAAAGSVYDTFHGQGFSGSAGNGYITSGWGKPGGPGGSWANGPSGKLITESSGIFSFPSTGIYYISFQLSGYAQNVNNRIIGNRIYATNSNANPPAHMVAHAEWNTKSFSGVDNGVGYGTAHCAVILKVTNTSNDKAAFWWQSEDNYNIGGGYGQQVIFYKLADL